MERRLLLVKYAEIHLKGLNRPFFERRLVAALRRLPEATPAALRTAAAALSDRIRPRG